jgi:hypothetical protein
LEETLENESAVTVELVTVTAFASWQESERTLTSGAPRNLPLRGNLPRRGNLTAETPSTKGSAD